VIAVNGIRGLEQYAFQTITAGSHYNV